MIKYRFSIPSDDDRNNVYSVLSGLPVLLISMVSEYVPQSLTNFPEFFCSAGCNAVTVNSTISLLQPL